MVVLYGPGGKDKCNQAKASCGSLHPSEMHLGKPRCDFAFSRESRTSPLKTWAFGFACHLDPGPVPPRCWTVAPVSLRCVLWRADPVGAPLTDALSEHQREALPRTGLGFLPQAPSQVRLDSVWDTRGFPILIVWLSCVSLGGLGPASLPVLSDGGRVDWPLAWHLREQWGPPAGLLLALQVDPEA